MSESGQDASRLEPWIVEAPDAVMRAVGLTKSYTTGRGQLELFRELNEALGTSPWLFYAADSPAESDAVSGPNELNRSGGSGR